ncbi:MAG: WavE lipopolysaccharide synthesis family protein [Chthonomonadales bacterium]
MRGICRPKDISFVVQGPIVRSPHVNTADVCASIRTHFSGAEIILSTWEGADVRGVDCDQVVLSKDPGPLPFAQNTNRQIVSTWAGIEKATRPMLMKTRTDLLFTSSSVLDYWGKWTKRTEGLRLTSERILVPHVYQRRPSYLYPTAFHPSDWCFFGLREDVELLFDIPLLTPSRAVCTVSPDPLSRIHWWWSEECTYAAPEQYIWVSALRKRFDHVAFEQFFHLTPLSLYQTELSFANNLVVLNAYDQFGIFCPKYPDTGRAFADFTLYDHADWLELYDLYCEAELPFAAEPDPALAMIVPTAESIAGWKLGDARIRDLRRAGCVWEARLIEAIITEPTFQRDASTGGSAKKPLDHLAAQLAKTHLAERIMRARQGSAMHGAALHHSTRESYGEPAASERPGHRVGIVWHGPIFDPSGYADEARQFLLALDGADVRVAARPIAWSARRADLNPMDDTRLRALTARPDMPGAVHVSHTFAVHFQRWAGAAVNVGRTMFETDRLPEEWVAACNWMDRVWVPSEFNVRTFADAGVAREKLAVIPGALNIARYNPATQPLPIEGAKGYNFLSVFDWSLRKGWDVLIEAFVGEFDPKEDVALVLKVHSSLGYSMGAIAEMIAGHVRKRTGRTLDACADIILLAADIPAPLMPALYRAAHCFVLPTRGEGWGRPFMEAMAMGLPVIGTNWSGNTAFMTPETAYLLDYVLAPVGAEACREVPAFLGHQWAEPDGMHLRELMRHVFTHRDEAAHRGARAREHIARNFSYSAVSQIILNEVDALITARATAAAATG